MSAATAALLFVGAALAVEKSQLITEHVVTTVADSGPGSLRAAIQAANATPGPDRIGFGHADGLFRTPQTIELESSLPPVSGEITIDGHIRKLLWRAYGATVSGGGRHRVFEVPEGATLRLAGITVVDGAAAAGGAVSNRGRLVLEGVTLLRNRATGPGGAIANEGGELLVINSTLADNQATRGGAVVNLGGTLRITNSTLYRNSAARGAAIYNSGEMHMANSIVHGKDDGQCVNEGSLDPASTHNIITSGRGCGTPILASDPLLGPFGHYNGPTPLFTLHGGSPAINLGDNASAIGEDGEPLRWDQRGNGDPRRVAGYTDIGAFEQQGLLPEQFVVDSVADSGLRACTGVVRNDCPLRAAIELASAAKKPTPIRFDSTVFTGPTSITLEALPEVSDRELLFDGTGVAEVTIIVPGPRRPWQAVNGVRIRFESAISADGGSP